MFELVYKCNRESLKTDPPHKYWLGTKQGKVIPNKVAISIEQANELAKVYFDLDEAKTALEAEAEKLHGQAEEKRMLLREVKAEGPVTSVKLRNTVQGIDEHGGIVEVTEVWEWKNDVGPPGEDVEMQKSDQVHLLSWEPDVYRPQNLERTRTLTPSEAETINRVLAQEGQTVAQLESAIRQLEDKANHVGTLIAALNDRLNEPLTLKEGM